MGRVSILFLERVETFYTEKTNCPQRRPPSCPLGCHPKDLFSSALGKQLKNPEIPELPEIMEPQTMQKPRDSRDSGDCSGNNLQSNHFPRNLRNLWNLWVFTWFEAP